MPHANVCLVLLQQSKMMTNNVTYFDRALGALLCLVSCDQGSIAHVCCCYCSNNCSFSVSLTVSHMCHIKHYIWESDHTVTVSQYNTDYNMVSKNRVTYFPKFVTKFIYFGNFLICFYVVGCAEGQNVCSLITHLKY